MKPIQTWLDEYSSSHRNPVNKSLHWLCIPPIVFSALGLLRAVTFGTEWINGASLAILFGLVYYSMLSWRLALGMVAVFAVMYWGLDASYSDLGRAHVPLMIAIFVAAWVGQFIGHKIEGVKPSFFKDLQFLMIGPLWLLADLYRRMQLRIVGTRTLHG